MKSPTLLHLNALCAFLLQAFSAVFDASIDGIPLTLAKGRSLTFELMGEGNLPRISIVKPVVRNKKGQPLALFKRILVGRQQRLTLQITNDGTLPSKVRRLSTSFTVKRAFAVKRAFV